MSKKTKLLVQRTKRRLGHNLITIYYLGNRIVKTNRAKYSHTAVLACVNNMQFNKYEATHAEVFDGEDGVVHAIVKAELVRGKHEIRILFKREVQKEN